MRTAPTIALRQPEVRLTGASGASASRRGPRSINADAVACATDPATGCSAFVVADGVGDQLLAARAARTAATVSAHVGAHSGAHAGILAAQQELLREFAESGADSVLVVAVLPGDGGPWDIAWVGDCRAYRWNGRVLHQITTDHTVAEYLRAQGHQPAPRMSHLVTTSVRTARPETIGRAATGVSSGRLLLSTDGVHKRLGIAVVKSVLATAATPELAANTLVDTAIRDGGTDNSTALVVDRR